jgi:2-keto-3-deoxy-L-rhamnonate aldolase RhmA
MESLKKRLALRSCFGTFLKVPRWEIVDVLALAGYDFVICDMEHAQISEVEAREVIHACVANELDVVVRLPEPTQGVVNRLIEAGASGIQMPRVREVADATLLRRHVQFPPVGWRSVSTANRDGEYGNVPLSAYLSAIQTAVLVVGQLETREGHRPFDAVLEPLDVAFIGPADLSVDYGAVDRPDDPSVVAHVSAIELAAGRTGTIMGTFVTSPERAGAAVEAGYRYIAVGSELSRMASSERGLVLGLRTAGRIGVADV